jgi:hypothetical protein
VEEDAEAVSLGFDPPKRRSRRHRADWRGGRGVGVVISGGGVMVVCAVGR